MNTASLTAARLDEIVAGFSDARVAVLGDYFLDRYLDVDPLLAEISVETGLPAHQVVAIRCSAGAAGTVVNNLAALGAGSLQAIGFTGDDGESFELRRALRHLDCSVDHLHVSPARFTPTYLKPNDRTRPGLEGEHSRYDTKNRAPTPTSLQDQIVNSLHEVVSGVDAVIVLDQLDEPSCGVVTQAVREALIDTARQSPQLIFWADSRSCIQAFRGLVIKPNAYETMGMGQVAPGTEVAEKQLLAAARQLRASNEAPLVVTRGSAGVWVSDPEWTAVPGVQVTGPTDPTGAGDSFTAGAVLALASGATLPEAATVGNLVASITIEQIGTTGVAAPAQLAERLALWQQQC